MSRRTRFASDLALAPRGCERAGTIAACRAICVALAWCALWAGPAVADSPGGTPPRGWTISAYDPALPPSRPSPTVRPGPQESTVVVISDEDENKPAASALRQPVGLTPGAERWIGPPQEESNPLGSSSMFAGLPPMQVNESAKQKSLPATNAPPAAFNQSSKHAASENQHKSDHASDDSSVFWQLFSGQPAYPAAPQKPTAQSSADSDAGWFQRFAGGWPFGQPQNDQPQKDPFGPPSAQQFSTAAPNASSAPVAVSTANAGRAGNSATEPTRLPAVFTPDENVTGLWQQLSARGNAPAAGSASPPTARSPQAALAASQAPPPRPSGTATTEAVSNRMAGLIHQFVASNDEPQYAPRPSVTQSPQPGAAAVAATRAPAANAPEENSWATLWQPMTMTRDGQEPNEATLAQSQTRPYESSTEEDEIPSLLMPFYFTTNDGKPGARVASGRAGGTGDSIVSQSSFDGGARPVAFLQDADDESLPQPAKDADERLQPEDLGIPGEPPKPPSADGTAANGEEAKNLVTADKVGEEPPDNSLQFLRFTGILLKPGQTQFDVGLTYTFSENQFPFAFVDGGGAVVGVDEANFRLRDLEVPFELRCGLLKRVQFFIGSSVGWSNAEFTVDDIEIFKNDGGIGDVYSGLTFQFREQSECSPHVIGTIGLTAPTGNDPFSTAEGFSPSGPALGGGFWSIFGNLLCIRTYDPVTIFYGVGTNQSFEHEYVGLDIRPGAEYNYTFGAGFAVNERMTLSTRFRGAWVDNLTVDGQRVEGSTLEPMSLRMAVTMAKKKRIIEPFIEFGITEDATTSYFGCIWTF